MDAPTTVDDEVLGGTIIWQERRDLHDELKVLRVEPPSTRGT